jgi:DNA-binding CsgD family transcriptional regulator
VFHGRGLATANGIDLIAAIYDAALDSERWPLVLDRLAETLGASAGTLIRQNLITAKGKMIATRVDPKFGQLYNDHYSSLKILPNRAGRPPVGTCLTDRMIVRREEFVRTEFYSDFMRPWGFIISSVLKVHIFMEGDYEIYVSFGRSAKYGEWEPSHLELLRRFAPHLHRTAAVSAILSGSRATIGSLAAAVAAVGFAVFLVTEDCHILFANAKAEDLLRCKVGLSCNFGRLAAATPALTQRLTALARAGSQPGRAEGDIGGTLELPRGENHAFLLAHVVPLAANLAASIFDVARPAAAVLVVDRSADLRAQIQRFAAGFELTAAEIRVLAEIIGGDGLLAAAKKLKITEATARTHAKHIFDKTRTHRQADLTRSFFESSLPGSPSNV